MKYVVFENDGVIDLTAMKTFGVSVKDNDNPIGFFGTGLKYALAILLREDQKVEAYAGLEHLDFNIEKRVVRGKEFEIIQMNKMDMPFTTHLGANWQLWQAFREIYCNALDEGGSVYLSEELPKPEENKTYFIVQGAAFRQEYYNRDHTVLKITKDLMLADGDIEIYNRPSTSIYYRNVRVYDFERPAILTYNFIRDVTLTEDRTLKFFGYEFNKIPSAMVKLTNKQKIRAALLSPQERIESTFNYSNVFNTDEISKEFLEVLSEEYHQNTDGLNSSAREMFCKKTSKDSVKNMISEELTPVEEKQLARATLICKKIYKDFDKYPVLIVPTLGQQTMAMADMENKAIVLSKAAFRLGTKYLVSTMMEEYTHLNTGFYDCSRALQTHLFDTICTIVEDHILGEPI